jgi:hypothetical protein
MSITGQTGAGKSRYIESLIRQDLAHWPTTHAGLIVIDPHGEMFDGLMTWIAANSLNHLPIIPIDLRRQDRIVSYNPLRQRSTEPAVMIDNFVNAMAYVWGQEGTDQMPLFERWATNALYRLYHEKKTLADAWRLFTPGGGVISDLIEDPMIRRDWLLARKNPKLFEEKTESSVNRFRRFLLNKTMRAMFGQSHTSLDLAQALEEGQIVLISLGRKRGSVSQENVDLFATLLISDLWTAAEERGKCEHNTPFYVYLDEFQRFVTPAMAQSLAESRGFSIGLTLSNQFPRQILNAGPHGPRIYDEIRENARTKIVFRLRGKDDLEVAANEIFISTFDPMRVKYQHHSYKMIGHDLQYLPSYGRSTTETVGGAEQTSHSTGFHHDLGFTLMHAQAKASAVGQSHSDSVSRGNAEGTTWGQTQSNTTANGRSGSQSVGRTQSRSEGNSRSTNEAFGVSGNGMTDIYDEREFDEVYLSGEGIQSWNVSDAKAFSHNESTSTNTMNSTGWNESQSRAESKNSGGSRSNSMSVGKGRARSSMATTTDSISRALSGSVGLSESDSVAQSSSWSTAEAKSENLSPMLLPIMRQEPDAPIFWSIDEQLFLAMQKIHALMDREAFVLAGDMTAPVFIRTPDVHRSDVSATVIDLAVTCYQDKSGFALLLSDALERVALRDRESEAMVTVVALEPEVQRPRRRMGPK